MENLEHKNRDKECLMLSYLAYHKRQEIEILNDNGNLKDGSSKEWITLWQELNNNYTDIKVYDCEDYGIGDTQFIYTVDKNGRLIISFRGTKSLSDLITDIRFLKDKCIDVCYSPYYLKHFHIGRLPYVHQGFYEMFNLMKLELYHIVRNYLREDRPIHKILITGHSLGGSLAMIAATCLYVQFHHLITTNRLEIQNITFGAPKVGNDEFCRIYNLWFKDKSRHYFHNCDPIPYVPLLQFYAVGETIQINRPEDAGWFYSIEYHLLENYLKYF